MKLEKINYSDLNSKQKEIHNFQKVAGLLSDYGFNCIKLADDWQGADFLAYHHNGDSTLKVQLKGRITIDKKYLGKDIYMTFPCYNEWYLIKHDLLVDLIHQNAPWLSTKSWLEYGSYGASNPSRKILEVINFAKL